MELLIVEDNIGLREQMKWALSEMFTVFEAGSTKECVDIFSKEHIRLICLDMGLDNIPDKGLEIIDTLLKIDRRVKIIVITANTLESLGKEAIARGAFDYLNKPVDIEELKVILTRASRLREFENPEKTTETCGINYNQCYNMIGKCEALVKIFETIKKLSETEVNVLITGDSGTGKELCARAIHFHSARKEYPFVPINCGAIPENLLESEMFGYVKGAFTGAHSDKKGLIETADKGTLFLDEIGDMPKHLQAKLLRFLEDFSFQRLGDTSFCNADVRIIAATNRKDLSIEDNPVMRTDLYYRLSEFEIYLPPLKDRYKDILLIAEDIVKRNRDKFNMPKLKISSRTAKILMQYNWPGNVRELENKLSRASIACTNQIIEPEDLNLSISSIDKISFKDAKNLFEKNYISNALKNADYNISVTAKNIGISRPTLYDLIKKHGIENKDKSLI
jgi:two-component system NtrC family response regulator